MSGSSTNSPSGSLRVAIVDRYVPLYREGLYDALMCAPGFEFTITAAAEPLEKLGTVPFPGHKGWRWIDSPIHRTPLTRHKSMWQWGAVKAGFSRRFDALLMMANPNDPTMWLCAIAARLTRKRLVFWTHGVTRRDTGLRRRVRMLWLRMAHALVIYGHLGKVGCLQECLAPERCHVCYNSLDYAKQRRLRDAITPDQVAAARCELFGDARLPMAISLSRLNAFKKIDVLIRAHARLIGEGRDIRLLIVGDGPERAKLEALADEFGPAVRRSVKFLGECYDEERLSLLIAASNVAVTPGAIGLTVMHCLAYGVPCITHDDWLDQMPEFEAIIDGKTGGFFRKDDVDDLARVMQVWLDPAKKSQVAAACMRHIERFYTPQVQASVMLRALRGQPADDLWVAYQSPGTCNGTGH